MSPWMFAVMAELAGRGAAIEFDEWIHWDQRPVIALWNRGYLYMSNRYHLSLSIDGARAYERYADAHPELRKSNRVPSFIGERRKGPGKVTSISRHRKTA